MRRRQLHTKATAMIMTASMVTGFLPTTAFAVNGAEIAADGTYTSNTVDVKRVEEEDADDEWSVYGVKVSLTVQDGKFSDITVNYDNRYASGNNSYFSKAVSKGNGIQAKLLGQTATEDTINSWDSVSGATRTYTAIKEAALAAIATAGKVAEISTADLAAAIERAKGLDESQYTADSWKAMQEALTEAEGVLDNPVSQETVNDSTTKLTAAIDGLVLKPSKDTLAQAVANAEALTQSDYTTSSWEALQNAVNGAKAVLDNSDATQEAVNDAVTTLNNAINALVNTKVLSETIARAEALTELGYTADSWATLQGALSSAKTVLDNSEAAQAEVDGAASALDEAIKGLVSEEYKYVYAGLTWSEYWAAENVQAAGSTASSGELDAHSEYDKGAFDTVTRATTNHGLHRGSFQTITKIFNKDESTYDISYWSDQSTIVLTDGTSVAFNKDTVDHYEVYGLKYVPVKVAVADYEAFCAKYDVVENGGTLVGGYGEVNLSSYSATAQVTENTNGLKTAVKNADGSFSFSARTNGSDSGLKDVSLKTASGIEPEVKEANGSYGEFLRVDLNGSYGDLGANMQAVEWTYYGNDSTYSTPLATYGTKFASDNWMHKKMGIQLGLTDSLRCTLPEGTDGTGYWTLTVYALGYADYTYEFQATGDNIVGSTDELNAAISKAEALDGSHYTPATWAAVQNALGSAKEVTSNSKKKSEIDSATQALTNAMNALVVAVDGYVYGTVNVPYADYYYGELNDVTENATLQLDTADAVTATGYRESGMYDAVTSATTQKSTRFGTTYYTQSESGVEIKGIKDVNIAIPAALYDEAAAAIAEGKTSTNPVLDFVKSMTVSETAPSEYKVLNGDGTLGAMKTEVKADEAATAEITTSSVWGDYQISVDSELLPTTETMLGVIVETTDGAKYGMEHLENLWLRTGEIAFAITPNFTEPHGNTVDYKRHESLEGKTISKITYLVKDGADIVINTNLKVKNLLDEEGTVTGGETEFAEGAKVALSAKVPSDSDYKLKSVTYNGADLIGGTDYEFAFADSIQTLAEEAYVDKNYTFTVHDTEKTGIGQYTLTFEDEKYEDMSTTVVFNSEYAEGSVTVKDNKLVLPEGLDVATYLNSISSITVDGTTYTGNNLGATVFNENGSVNFDAVITSRRNSTTVFPTAGKSYTLDIASIGYPDVTNAEVTSSTEYVYGTVNVPYADYYYGELNPVAANPTLQLDAADAVTAAGYRESGMYDAVTSATTQKSTRFGTTYYTQSESGVEIKGLQAVNIAVPKALYDAATAAAIAEGQTSTNPVLDFVKSMTVSETAPSEYKVLNGDGTLGAMVTEVTVDETANAEITTSSRWGDYQISVESELLPTTDTMLGVIVETTDGAKYGMEHLENLWLRTGEIAFAVTPDFKEPHGNTVDYKRHESLEGKTISKITYLVKDGADIVINTDLKVKYLLDEEYGITGAGAVFEEGANVTLGIKVPEDSHYALTSVTYSGASLTAGTDYTYSDGVFTVHNTDKTGIGAYTLTFTDDKYEDISASVVFNSSYAEGSVTIKDNKLVLPEGLDVATYLNSISAISVGGVALKGNNLGTTVFNEDGSVNFDAVIQNRGNSTTVFPDAGKEYILELTSIGYPNVTSTVTSPAKSDDDSNNNGNNDSDNNGNNDSNNNGNNNSNNNGNNDSNNNGNNNSDNNGNNNSDNNGNNDSNNNGNNNSNANNNNSNSNNNSPSTGDTNRLWGWLSLVWSAVGGAGLLLFKRKKDEETR